MRNLFISLLMLSFGLLSYAQSSSGGDAFREALRSGNIDEIRKIASAKDFDVNQSITHNGDTPLTLAISEGNLDAFDILIALPKVDVNAKTSNLWTPLMFAARGASVGENEGKTTENQAHIKMIRKLLSMKADKTIQNSGGETALDIARKNQNKKIVKLLE